MTKISKAGGGVVERVGIRIRRGNVVILEGVEVLGLSAADGSDGLGGVVTLSLFVAFFWNRTAEFCRELAGR